MPKYGYFYSPFWPPVPNALRTLRISATSGTRTIGSMIASSDGGAGSPIRVYKFLQRYNKQSPSDYFFNNLGGNRNLIPSFNTFYNTYNSNK